MTDRTTVTDASAEPVAPRAPAPSYPGMPTWVKVGGIVTLILILLVVAIMFIVGVNHGPSRHMPSSSGSSSAPLLAIAI
jgi:uncharacterized membrane protein